jgi:hypothetical protein
MANEQPNVVVEQDELCMECGYNLRTLKASGVCPECATPVAKSLAFRQRAAAVNLRRFKLATKTLVLTGVLLGVEYLGSLVPEFTERQFGYMLWSELYNLRTILEHALHIALGVLVFVATLILVKVFRTRHLASSVATIACLVTAGFHLLLYLAVESHDWAKSFFPDMRMREFHYFWNNWCYAAISCCEFLLILGAALALRKYAVQFRNKALQVTTVLYPLLIAPIFVAWFVKGPMSGSTISWLKTRFPVTWYFHMADDATRFYGQWEWALAVVTILYWTHVSMNLRGHGPIRTAKKNLRNAQQQS